MSNELINQTNDSSVADSAMRQNTIVNVETDYTQSAFGGEMLRAIHEFLETHSTTTPLHIILH